MCRYLHQLLVGRFAPSTRIFSSATLLASLASAFQAVLHVNLPLYQLLVRFAPWHVNVVRAHGEEYLLHQKGYGSE